MRFLKYKISLVVRQQIDAFERETSGTIDEQRRYYLNYLFLNKLFFYVGGKNYVYLPKLIFEDRLPEFAVEGPFFSEIDVHFDLKLRNFVVGSIGSEKEVREYTPPNEGLVPIDRSQWQVLNIILNLDTSTNGQMLFIEKSTKIGSIHKIINGLVKKINSDKLSKFEISIKPIFDVREFWEWVNSTKHITKIKISVSTPNGLGLKSTFHEEAKAAKAAMNATKLTSEYKNPNGLKVDKDYLEGAIEYASKGGGEISASARKAPSYNSRNSVTEAVISVEDKDGGDIDRYQIAKELAADDPQS